MFLSGKHHEEFGHFVNFWHIFSDKNVLPPKLTEFLRLCNVSMVWSNIELCVNSLVLTRVLYPSPQWPYPRHRAVPTQDSRTGTIPSHSGRDSSETYNGLYAGLCHHLSSWTCLAKLRTSWRVRSAQPREKSTLPSCADLTPQHLL